MGSNISFADSHAAQAQPSTSGNSTLRLDLTTANAATASLAVGWYRIALAGLTGLAFAKLGGAASVPASGAAATASVFVLRDGGRLLSSCPPGRGSSG
jgi:hypothetical protein